MASSGVFLLYRLEMAKWVQIPLRQFGDGYTCAFFKEKSQLLKQ